MTTRATAALPALLLALVLGGCSLLNQGAPRAPSQSPQVVTSHSMPEPQPTSAPPGSPTTSPQVTSRVVPSLSIAPPSGTVTVTVIGTVEPTAAPPPAREGGGVAAFASPSGRIVCLMAAGEFVRCDYLGPDPAWNVPVPGCQLAFGRMLQVTDTAAGACVGDTLADSAVPGSEFTSWWRSGEPTTTVAGTALRAAVLPYGTALAVADFRCESAESGVTCYNTSTGHGFSLAREAYRIF